MCGHVGIAGSLEFKDEALMKRLFLLDYFRGPDSTGLAAIRNNGDIHIAKLASHPLDLFDMGRFKTALSGSTSKVFIGHNRAATKGAVNGLNAHPYQCGHIIGAHNGTLNHQSFEDLKKKLGEEFTTDSWAIFSAIERFGVQETIPMLTGAWSLVWYDTQENSLNFIRNKERPMWYAYTKEFDRLLWSSEWTFIDAALKINTNASHNYDLLVEEGTGYRYWQTEENIHYKFDMVELASKAKDKARPKPLVKELKGKDVAASCGDPFGRTGRQNGYGQWVAGKFTPAGSSSTQTGAISKIGNSNHSHGGKKLGTNVISMFGTPSNPLAGMISKKKFEDIASFGCSWCQATVDYDQVGVTVFERDDIVLCPDCSDNGKGKEPSSRVYTPNIQQLL